VAKQRKPNGDTLTAREIKLLAKAIVHTDKKAARQIMRKLAKSVKSLMLM
jgi:DNA-binding FadR family transcriptional regulator